MATVYDYGAYTVNGKTVHLKWLDAHIDDIEIVAVNDKTCGNSGYYGINGTFFDPGTGYCDPTHPNTLLGVAVQDGASVKSNGSQNAISRGTLIKLKNNLADGTFIFTKKMTSFPITHNSYTVNISNVQWAIGGISLLLDDTSITSSSDFSTKISSENPPAYSTDRPRTAIGYKGGNRVILCAIFDGDDLWNGGSGYGCNVYDVRTIMLNKFNCSMGVMLDGGGSTQISFKQGTSNNYHQTEARCIQVMVTAPM